MRSLLALLAIVTMIGCDAQPPLSTGRAMNLDDAAARLALLSGCESRPFATRDFGRDQNDAARSVLVGEDAAASLAAKIRDELGPGLLAFVGCTRSLAEPPDKGSEVVVAPGMCQFDICVSRNLMLSTTT